MTKAKTQGNDNNDGVVATDVLDELLAVAGITTEPTTAVIVFAQDYRGVLTGEQYYLKGQAVEFPIEQAQKLVDAERATYKD